MLLFLTDIHLDHLRVPQAARAFGESLVREYPNAEALLVTGDIASGHNIERFLPEFAEGVADRKIFWIEGNHDYYRSSIYKMQRRFRELDKLPNLVWLDTAEPVVFDDFVLVGKYSWYDALNGTPLTSEVILSDFSLVGEFRQVFNELEWAYMADRGSRNPLLVTLRRLAETAVAEARVKLERALKHSRHVLFATHVAPFEGAAWHEGKVSNSDWQPWFSCRQMGDMLQDVASQHPDHRFLVLCGHSHSPGEYRPAPNLKVLTGKAEYGAPDVAGVLESPFAEW